jgi:peptidoglycan/LPS O-acetylase OafA/YrhL
VEIKYRPEIDGLRTVAVLSVIIYHAEFIGGGNKLLSGGFLGVDIFFVISGFLITSIIMNEFHKTGTISIPNFYQRRARRLLPALLAVMLASLPVAWVILPPEQLIEYAKSLLSSLAFGSNFFWNYNLQQYGAESALLKPFLHTWSLAVEEQYYIVYPIMLLAMHKWCRSYVTVLMLAGFLLSLQYAEWMTATDRSFSFYMLPTRFWELLAGGLLANILLLHPKKGNGALLNKTMPALGFYLIVYSVFFIDFDKHNHPGFVTLLPVLGTVLIIWFANKNELITQILSSKAFVAIGLISYSLYLWHYPVFAFGRMVSSSNGLIAKIIWITLAFLASIASYYFVEKPLRNKQTSRNRRFWIVVVSMLLVIFSSSTFFIRSNGDASRFDEVKAYSEFRGPEFDRLKGSIGTSVTSGKISDTCFNRVPFEACHFGDGLFVTLGDSYAAQYENTLLRKLNSSGHGLISLTAGLCPFVKKDMLFAAMGYFCPQLNRNRWQVVNGFESKKIFLISSNVALFKRVQSESLTLTDVWEDYLLSVERLLDKGHRVILITGAPGGNDAIVQRWKIDALRQSFGTRSPLVFHKNNKLYNQWEAKHKRQFGLKHENLIQIRVGDLLCPENSNRKCLVIGEQGSYYNKGTHLSSIGADLVIEHLLSEVKRQAWID